MQHKTPTVLLELRVSSAAAVKARVTRAGGRLSSLAACCCCFCCWCAICVCVRCSLGASCVSLTRAHGVFSSLVARLLSQTPHQLACLLSVRTHTQRTHTTQSRATSSAFARAAKAKFGRRRFVRCCCCCFCCVEHHERDAWIAAQAHTQSVKSLSLLSLCLLCVFV